MSISDKARAVDHDFARPFVNRRVETPSTVASMAASLASSVQVVTVEREHCFRHESEIKKQKKGE